MPDTRTPAEQPGRFRALAAPPARSFVVEYWGIARDLRAMGGFTITPDRFGELFWTVDAIDATLADGRGGRLPRASLIGLLDGPIRIESCGVVRCFSARVEPWAIGTLARRGAIGDGLPWVDCGRLFGGRSSVIDPALAALDWPTLVGEFDAALSRCAGEIGRSVEGVGLVRAIVGEAPPSTPDLADGLDVSRRSVERMVRDSTRLSPKQLAGLARFQRARDAIWADPSIDLAALAARSGYADQAHMTRQFRRYGGTTPARFAREMVARKSGSAGADVAIVQSRRPDAG